MIKLLVVSDTHGDADWIRALWLSHTDYDLFLHLGDSELPASMLYPFVSIKGNCDYFFDYPKTKQIRTKYGNIFMVHNATAATDEDILKQDVRLFLCGHTHRYEVRSVGPCYFANPGSLIRPRDCSAGTYMEIELSENDIRFRKCFFKK